jgi:hypothetical protein
MDPFSYTIQVKWMMALFTAPNTGLVVDGLNTNGAIIIFLFLLIFLSMIIYFRFGLF